MEDPSDKSSKPPVSLVGLRRIIASYGFIGETKDLEEMRRDEALMKNNLPFEKIKELEQELEQISRRLLLGMFDLDQRKKCGNLLNPTDLKDPKCKEFSVLGAGPRAGGVLPRVYPEESSVLGAGAGAGAAAVLVLPPHFPEKYSWREKGVFLKVADQGILKICWADSSTEVLKVAYFIKHKELIQFSRQQLVDGCATDTLAYDHSLACLFSWLKINGLVSESNYPWTGIKGSLKNIEPEYVLEGYESVPVDHEDDIQRKVHEHPVCVVILSTLQLKRLKKGEVYHVTKKEYDPYLASCKKYERPVMHHAVILTGWNEVDGVPVWEAQNSYGDNYCDGGYFYIVRGSAIDKASEYNPLLEVVDVKGVKKLEK